MAVATERKKYFPSELAPQPPMPAPGVCRWCAGRLRRLTDDGPADYCQNGCAANDAAPFTGHCGECGRQFKTGRSLMASSLCYECDQTDAAAHAKAHQPLPKRLYNYKRVGRGTWMD